VDHFENRRRRRRRRRHHRRRHDFLVFHSLRKFFPKSLRTIHRKKNFVRPLEKTFDLDDVDDDDDDDDDVSEEALVKNMMFNLFIVTMTRMTDDD